jgi:pSer/pThr/pTyr-binding forkhead associated (FHA) protein
MGVLKAKRNGQMVAYRLDKAAVIVGSGDACNIRVPDAGLVTRHCQILKMENGYVLRDMSGEVGTFVNGKKVKEHLLSDRDLIQVGKERFTFSISEGENTARVAVSVAPPAAAPAKGNTARVAAAPPAKSGNTGRVAAAAPARTGNTGRIAAAPPPAAVEGPRPSTQRVSKGTQKMQKTTGTKKITARTAAAMGYQTSRSTFAMPSTRKGKMIAAGAVLGVLAIGGIFYAINAGQVKPEKIKEEIARQLDELRKYKPEQIIEIDAGYEKILADHLEVRKYVNQLYTNIEKEHNNVHTRAEAQKAAAKAVQPFLTKFAQTKAKPEELKAQAQALWDECRAALDNYGNTVFADKLKEIQAELKTILESAGPDWPTKIIPMKGLVRQAATKGDCVGAVKLIDDFGKEFNEKEKVDLFKQLEDQRSFVKRESMAFVNREITKAQKDLADASIKKEDVKKRMEGFKEGLHGFKEALDKLEGFIATIKV